MSRKETLKRYQSWMITERILAPKTCNLRMTAIRTFLEYASQEHLWSCRFIQMLVALLV